MDKKDLEAIITGYIQFGMYLPDLGQCSLLLFIYVVPELSILQEQFKVHTECIL